jgi:hypothetical protein
MRCVDCGLFGQRLIRRENYSSRVVTALAIDGCLGIGYTGRLPLKSPHRASIQD